MVFTSGPAEPAKPRAAFEPTLAAVADLARELPTGDTDLGAITLKIAPLVASGTVVDQVGKPVAGAVVTPRYRRGADGRRVDQGVGAAE